MTGIGAATHSYTARSVGAVKCEASASCRADDAPAPGARWQRNRTAYGMIWSCAASTRQCAMQSSGNATMTMMNPMGYSARARLSNALRRTSSAGWAACVTNTLARRNRLVRVN